MVENGLPWLKTCSPVNFTTASGAPFVENFLLLTLIVVHPLPTPFQPFFWLPHQHSFERSPGNYAGIQTFLPGKNPDPFRVVLMYPYSSSDDYALFPGNYVCRWRGNFLCGIKWFHDVLFFYFLHGF